MAKYLLRRTAQILITLFVFLSLVFFIVNAQPGDVSNFYALNPDVPLRRGRGSRTCSA